MVNKISTVLAAALVFASVGAASARPAWETTRFFAPSVERYDGWSTPTATSATAICPVRPAATITASQTDASCLRDGIDK